MTEPNLKPRAIAVLVALRTGPLTIGQLRTRIGDGREGNPNGLLELMRVAPLSLVTQRPRDDRWYLTHEGLGWLQRQGLDAVPEACAWHLPEVVS